MHGVFGINCTDEIKETLQFILRTLNRSYHLQLSCYSICSLRSSSQTHTLLFLYFSSFSCCDECNFCTKPSAHHKAAVPVHRYGRQGQHRSWIWRGSRLRRLLGSHQDIHQQIQARLQLRRLRSWAAVGTDVPFS